MPTLSKTQIVKNTIVLYLRTLLLMIIALFTSRVILSALGVEDFGLYNVVGGVVAMLSILTGSLSAAISRFITFELGTENQDRLKIIFSSAITIQIIFSICVLILVETLGVWFLNSHMNIAPERIYAANLVLQFSAFTFIINLLSVPFNAIIIAHEKMSVFAYIGIIDGAMKLGVAYLIYFADTDRLIFYAALLSLEAFLIQVIYVIYCNRKFSQYRCRPCLDRTVLRSMFGFAGWNFIGASSSVLRSQGVNILLNIFGGTILNAAQGIATQVNGAVVAFVSNFMTAINPSITKSYALGNRDYMISLVLQGARFSYYLLFLFSLPVLLETDYILSIWLKTIPEYTSVFVKFIILFSMCETLSTTLITAMLATGNIRNYQLIVGGIVMLNLPLSYLFLHLGYAPQCTIVISIVLSLLALMARLILLRPMIGLSIKRYFNIVILNVIAVSVIAPILPYVIFCNMEQSISRFILVGATCGLSTLIVVYCIGLNYTERILLNNKVRNYFSKAHDQHQE